MDRVVDYIDKALKIAQDVTKVSGPKLQDFNRVVEEDKQFQTKIAKLKDEIQTFSRSFPLPGF